jgi:hypothetical protein
VSRGVVQPKNLGASAGSKRWKSDDNSVEIVSTELMPCDALDLLADISGVVAPAAGLAMAWKTGVGNIGASLQQLTEQLAGGRLTSYLPRLLAGSTLIARGQGAGNFGMADRAAFNKAFMGRTQFIAPAVKLAVEVNYTSFLDGVKSIGIDLMPTTMTAPSSSEDSDPSTTDIG